MRVTVIPIVTRALGKVYKCLERGLAEESKLSRQWHSRNQPEYSEDSWRPGDS